MQTRHTCSTCFIFIAIKYGSPDGPRYSSWASLGEGYPSRRAGQGILYCFHAFIPYFRGLSRLFNVITLFIMHVSLFIAHPLIGIHIPPLFVTQKKLDFVLLDPTCRTKTSRPRVAAAQAFARLFQALWGSGISCAPPGGIHIRQTTCQS
jgi:hypothetical protein